MSSKKDGVFGSDDETGPVGGLGNPFAVDEPALSPFATDDDDDDAADSPASSRLKSDAANPRPFATDDDAADTPSAAARGAVSNGDAPAGGGMPFSTGGEEKGKSASAFSDTEEDEPAREQEPEQAPAPAKRAAPTRSASSLSGRSGSISQLALRAIFGVDRELSESEILDRARSLKGIRQVARVSEEDAGAVEGIKQLVEGLGFGDGEVSLYVGDAPIEFIDEGGGLLAVQNDGSFAPGVRETLMIVAGELAKL